jgi:hypothetical protein
MFRALLSHLQEALNESRFGDYCVQLLIVRDGHQICVRVVPPEDEQVMPETCRDF